jgi:Mg-chelatase subunit ChlD
VSADLPTGTGTDVEATLARIASAREPFFIGVRHHSPVLAAAVAPLLDAWEPDAVLVELPLELEPWLGWLGRDDLVAPVALAVARRHGERLGFYPFADFSPELAAVRWARSRGVPVHAIDLPASFDADELSPSDLDPEPSGHAEGPPVVDARASLVHALARRYGATDPEELWDRVVEVASYGAEPERVRRAALAVGWMHRADRSALAGGAPGADALDRLVDHRDRVREAWMVRRTRELLDTGVHRPAAVIGAFHAAALAGVAAPPLEIDWPAIDIDAVVHAVPGDRGPNEASSRRRRTDADTVTSLVPYSFDLLDSRSGYPAGIRDPVWQQAVYEGRGAAEAVDEAAARLIVEICAELRAAGHVAGVPDARECVRLAADLARVRGFAAPGRREVIEAIECALGQGERHGRGRALARASGRVLVGSRRGSLPPAAPRSGLEDEVFGLLDEVGLPGPSGDREPVSLRLDPLRSERDRRRHLALARLSACNVVYAEERASAGVGGRDAITRSWTVRWQPATAATLAFAGAHGVTLEQAATGSVRRQWHAADAADELTPAVVLALVARAAECGAVALVREWVGAMPHLYLPHAGLDDVVAAHGLLERISAGHVPGLPADDDGQVALPPHPSLADLVAAAIAAVEGIAGSDDLIDARALLALTHIIDRQRQESGALGEGRLHAQLDAMADGASPLMQGAALGAAVVLGHLAVEEAGARLSSWVDGAGSGPASLARRLAGALVTCAPLLEGSTEILDPVADRIESIEDEGFLSRLPALREGFEVLSPRSRDRLLEVVAERLGIEDHDDLRRAMTSERDPALLAAGAAADAAGRRAVAALDPELAAALLDGGRVDAPHDEAGDRDEEPTPADGPTTRAAPIGGAIAPLDRWRLVLGRQSRLLTGRAGRAARAIDDLYGRGHGEGSGQGVGGGGGDEAPFPTAREWSQELDDLFGARVRDEVLGRAAARGRTDALLALDADADIAPSVELLEQVLALKGAVGESKLAALRRLVQRIVDELARELATRLRPALSGVTVPRPTSRPVGPLDLRRTVAANLHTARRDADGRTTLVPDRLIFDTRARRRADWHVTLVVDVSGSMEASIIHSALVAAIINGLPALSVRFVTFSTEVLDLTPLVDDPLALLLEVSVGGGTDIGLGLRYARERLVVPGRSIVVVVSDFEEGCSVGRLLDEVRQVVGSGARALGLAALDDQAAPRFNRGIAEQVAAAGMPVAALSPLELARWIGEQVRA